MRNEPITWHVTAMAFSGLATAICVMVALAAEPAMWYWAALCAIIFGAMACLQRQRAQRTDLHPDILAAIAPAESLFSIDDLHLSVTARPVQGVLQLLVIAQNTRAGEGHADIELVASPSTPSVDALRITLPPAGVVAAATALPFDVLAGPELKWEIRARARLQGQLIRFRRYRFLTHKVSPVTQAVGAAGGLIVWGGGTFLRLTIPELSGKPVSQNRVTHWSIKPLWQIGDRSDVSHLQVAMSAIADALPMAAHQVAAGEGGRESLMEG